MFLVDLIDSEEQFENLKQNWENVYQKDPIATIFLSWALTKAWILLFPQQWLVLCVRPSKDSPYVAFFPLRRINNLCLISGGPPLSDYTGFVCQTGYEKGAILSIADFIQRKVRWNKLSLESVLDSRLDLFLRCFPDRSYRIERLAPTACPTLPLPDTWEEYMMKSIRKNMRKNLRRTMMEVDSLSDGALIETDPENLDNQIEAFINTRLKQWGQLPNNPDWYRTLFRTAFSAGSLQLYLLKSGNNTIGGSVGFVDSFKKILYDFNLAYDPDYQGIRSPGHAVTIPKIRWAIERGFKYLDFCCGGYPYKFKLGARERYSDNVIIERKGIRKHVLSLSNKTVQVGRRFIKLVHNNMSRSEN